jgi:hypothetical protein
VNDLFDYLLGLDGNTDRWWARPMIVAFWYVACTWPDATDNVFAFIGWIARGLE